MTKEDKVKQYTEQAYNESSVLTWGILESIVKKAYLAGYEEALKDVKHTVFDHQIKIAYENAKHNKDLPVSKIWSREQKLEEATRYQAFFYCLSRLQEAGVINDDWR